MIPAVPLILVVDDDVTITAAISRALIRGGRRVIAVNDPNEALEVVARESVDLVITDKDMPQMTGHMLLDLLRDSHPDLPCILLTGVPSLESALVASKLAPAERISRARSLRAALPKGKFRARDIDAIKRGGSS